MTVFFRVEELSKSYPGVKANDEITFGMDAGEIHALLGENGSGKSTLVKTVYGLIRPDSGRMILRDQPYAPASPNVARSQGIAMVFQHFSLFDALTVSENISLGMNRPPSPRRLGELIRRTGENYGLVLNPEQRIGDLSVGERQRVEIVRCLLQEPKLLIMDEPTSVLTPQETGILFATLRKLSEEGTSILYISHKLEEIRSLCHHATILRAGQVVATCNPRQQSARQLAEMMVGSSFAAPARAEDASAGEPMLEIRNLSTSAVSDFGTNLGGVSLAVRRGEILGVAGIAGNGQEELMAALSGEAPASSGEILMGGDDLGRASPDTRRQAGLLTAPEERIGHAAAADMSLTENAFMTGCARMKLARHGVIDWPAARKFADRVIAEFDVRTTGPDSAASSLSGGNLQKFVIGREILQDPLVLVVNQPTWGVDASAAAAIRQALLDLAAAGAAVVAISQDLDELIEISTRISVLNEGRMSDARPVGELSREEIGMLMGGSHDLRRPEEAHAEA